MKTLSSSILDALFKQRRMIRCLILFCLGVLTLTVQAQVKNEPNLINPVPPSPNAAALGAYGNTPVTLYTGQANVSIPIFTIAQDNFSLPISLSYNSTGLKVEEIASNVGLGWSLNAAGVITRTIYGRDDFGANGFQTTTYSIPTDLPIDGLSQLTEEQDKTLWEFAKQNHDSEPDVFYFNFAGHTGKFVMDKNGTVHTIPHQKLQIKRGNGWTIIGEDGLEFQFRAAEYQQSKQYTKVNSSESSGDLETFISSWYLTKIKFPNSNRSIDFQYVEDDMHWFYSGNYERKRFKNFLVGADQDVSSYSFNGVNTIRLSHIVFDGGKVSFEYGNKRCDLTGDKILQKIAIKNATDELLKTFVLKYTYDGWNGSDAATVPADCGNRDVNGLRLMLKELIEGDPLDNIKKPPYRFSYYEGTLPSRNSKSQDYWGYYNGVINKTLIPDIFILPAYTNFGTNRNPDIEYSKRGVLKSVQYPTGGYTTFEYEPHYVHSSDYIELPPEIVRGQKVLSVTTRDFSVYKETEPFTPGVNGVGTLRLSGTLNSSCTGCDYIRWTILKQQPNGTFAIVWTGYNFTLAEANGSINLDKDDVFKISHEILVSQPIYEQVMSVGYSLDLLWTGSKPSQPLAMTGGVRISKITDHDGVTGNSNIRMFEYKQSVDNEYSGFVLSSPKFFIDHYEEVVTIDFRGPETSTYINLTSTSNVPLTTTQGSHVGYSEVHEYTGIENLEHTFNSNGKTVYKYWAPNEIRDPMPTRDNNYREFYGLPYANIISQDWKRGLLKEQTVYSLTSGVFKEVKKVNNYYTFVDRNNPNANYSSVIGFKAAVATEFKSDGAATRLLNITKYQWGYYRYESGYSRLDSVVEKMYDQSDVNKFTEKTTIYNYNLDNLQVAREEVLTGTEKLTTVYTYPKDYTDGSGFVKKLVDANMITLPIEKVTYREDLNGARRMITGGLINIYDDMGKGHLAKIKMFEWSNPVSVSNFKFSNQQNTGTLPSNSVKASFDPDDRYRDFVTYTYNATTDKLASVQTDRETRQYLWGYNNTLPVAEVVNATSQEIAYTGFEREGTGNWTLSGTLNYNASEKFTGVSSYNISATSSVSRTGLTRSQSYTVSFWCRNGVPTVNGIVPVAVNIINGWTHYERIVTGATSVTIAGNAIIDELRLYPSTARMTTYTYLQGTGVTAATDVNNVPTYYEYDGLGRLTFVKDLRGSVVKSFKYNYQYK